MHYDNVPRQFYSPAYTHVEEFDRSVTQGQRQNANYDTHDLTLVYFSSPPPSVFQSVYVLSSHDDRRMYTVF